MNKFAVITTINFPTNAIMELSKNKDWKIIVVGDNKTPKDWFLEDTIFLSIESQKKLNYNILNLLPSNHYSRKIIGYLYAVNSGADVIYDIDDDNFPLNNWGEIPEYDKFTTISGNGFINIYKYFSDENIWPRGYPLNLIQSSPEFTISKKKRNIGIWQFLANGDPDVDAINRLIFSHNDIAFKNNGPLVLDKNVITPFNSQNTFFFKECFSLLYLPAFVSFRFTDILRGLIAQPIMWSKDLFLGISNASVYQDRNPHNLMDDFGDEISCYLNSELVVDISKQIVNRNDAISTNLFKIYEELFKSKIIKSNELKLLESWIRDTEK